MSTNPNNSPYSFGVGSSGTPWNTPYDPNAGAVGSGPGGINTTPQGPPLTMSGSATAPSFSPAQVAPPPAPTGLQPGQGSPGDVGYNVNAPGAGENASASYLNYYSQSGTPTTSNNAQQAYTDFRNSQPANMDPYYNNAQRLSDNAINKQMAARGQYGSSSAVGTLAAADTSLRAQQAKDEAQYGLSRYGLEEQLASGSDSSSLNQSQNEENWMKGISDLGFANQKEGAARAQQGLDWTKQAADTASGIEGQVGGSEIANDQDLLNGVLGAGGAAATDNSTAAQSKLAASQAQDARTTAAITSALAYFV